MVSNSHELNMNNMEKLQTLKFPDILHANFPPVSECGIYI